MPKTSKTKKSPSLLSRSISLSTTKGRLILFVLVFAVIGGSIMLYNSFASANPRIHYANRIGGFDGAVKVVDAYASYVSYTSETNPTNKVWNLPVVNAKAETFFSIPKNNSEVDYSVCLLINRPTIAGQAAKVQLATGKESSPPDSTSVDITIKPTDQYQTVCSPATTAYSGGEKGLFDVYVYNKTGGPLYLRAISINANYVSYTSQ